MNAAAVLFCDDDDDDNVQLRDFYTRNLPFLRKIKISAIPHHILVNMAAMLHKTLMYDSDWQEFAYSFGITDSLILCKIEASAKASKELPLYFSLKYILQHGKKFGHIIEILLQKQRMDVLTEIKSFVDGLLEESSTEVKSFVSVEEHLSKNLSEELENTSNASCHSNKKVVNEFFKGFDSSELKNKSKSESSHESIILCGSHVSNVKEMKLSKYRDFSVEETQVIQIAPPEDRLIIYLQHTEHDFNIAKELSAILRAEGIIVKMLSDIEHLLIMNSEAVLNSILQEVDFIVPIVSEKLLEQVFPRIDDEYLESSDAVNNRYLYVLFMKEYQNKGCINLRVRPVLVPEISRQLMQNHLIFSSSLRLWKEVPKLIKILKKTKTLISRYSS